MIFFGLGIESRKNIFFSTLDRFKAPLQISKWGFGLRKSIVAVDSFGVDHPKSAPTATIGRCQPNSFYEYVKQIKKLECPTIYGGTIHPKRTLKKWAVCRNGRSILALLRGVTKLHTDLSTEDGESVLMPKSPSYN
jgi:hypothetical protein